MKIVVLASAIALGLAGSAFAADEAMPPDAKANPAGAAGVAPDSKAGAVDAAAGSSASGTSANSVTAPAIEWPVVQEGPKGNDNSGQEASKSGSSSSSTGAAEGTAGKDMSKDTKPKK